MLFLLAPDEIDGTNSDDNDNDDGGNDNMGPPDAGAERRQNWDDDEEEDEDDDDGDVFSQRGAGLAVEGAAAVRAAHAAHAAHAAAAAAAHAAGMPPFGAFLGPDGLPVPLTHFATSSDKAEQRKQRNKESAAASRQRVRLFQRSLQEKVTMLE